MHLDSSLGQVWAAKFAMVVFSQLTIQLQTQQHKCEWMWATLIMKYWPALSWNTLNTIVQILSWWNTAKLLLSFLSDSEICSEKETRWKKARDATFSFLHSFQISTRRGSRIFFGSKYFYLYIYCFFSIIGEKGVFWVKGFLEILRNIYLTLPLNAFTRCVMYCVYS